MKVKFSRQAAVVSGQSSVVSRQWLIICIGALSFIIFYGCGGKGGKAAGTAPDRQSSIDSIQSIESKLKVMKTPDAYTFNKAITAYTSFASNFPQDTMASSCLFNAAGIAMSLSQYQRALNLYDTLSTKYPSFKKAPDCIFIRGFIYDDKLKDTAKARVMYQMVIDKYPHDSMAAQARAAIAILGKSYDEIIKEFEEKNKGKK